MYDTENKARKTLFPAVSAICAVLILTACNTPRLSDDFVGNDGVLEPEVESHHKWKYIIIHHSATEVGSAALFDRLHKKRGWDGVGYHFVIDNGTKGKREGEIEITYRWRDQINGAHCRASRMNSKGIGICLVGNFSEGHVSEAQLLSLIHLVRQLQAQYKIPRSRVIGHGRVHGANTECPGSHFPWKAFYSNILD